MNWSPVESICKNVKMAKSSGGPVRPQWKRKGQKICTIVSNLARVFQSLPAQPKQYVVFDVFCDFQCFFQLENLGSDLAMCPDDRFLPQGKQILPEICQVRPMPYLTYFGVRFKYTIRWHMSDFHPFGDFTYM